MLVQTKFKVCVGVRSGPKGPVIDFVVRRPRIPVQANLRFALGYVQSEPKGRVIHSSICGGAPGSTWKYAQAFDGLEALMLGPIKI